MKTNPIRITATHDRRSVNKRTIIRAKAPLRISFAGGGTDLPHYYEDHGGAVLSSTINRYSYVTLYPRDDNEVLIRSADVGTSVNFALDREPIFDGVLDLAKAAIRRIGVELGFELDIYTEAPRGSGLGGSSAVTAAILGAVREFAGVLIDAYELAELNYLIERQDLAIAGGKQDQYATTFGGFNLIEFHRDRVLVTPLRIEHDILNDLECHLLLCYTGHLRLGMGLIESQVKLYRDGATLDAMKRIHEQAYEMMEALLHGRLNRFGELLDEAYRAKREMNPHVSDPKIDSLYELAKAEGAVGGKLCGAGGGGYMLLYVPGPRMHSVRKALEAEGGQFTSFSLEERGLQTWRSRCR